MLYIINKPSENRRGIFSPGMLYSNLPTINMCLLKESLYVTTFSKNHHTVMKTR
jgi:hypothetical protein